MRLFRFAVMLFAVVTLSHGTHAFEPKVGEALADFQLPRIGGSSTGATGEPLSLSSFRGQKVLLLVFASW